MLISQLYFLFILCITYSILFSTTIHAFINPYNLGTSYQYSRKLCTTTPVSTTPVRGITAVGTSIKCPYSRNSFPSSSSSLYSTPSPSSQDDSPNNNNNNNNWLRLKLKLRTALTKLSKVPQAFAQAFKLFKAYFFPRRKNLPLKLYIFVITVRLSILASLSLILFRNLRPYLLFLPAVAPTQTPQTAVQVSFTTFLKR